MGVDGRLKQCFFGALTCKKIKYKILPMLTAADVQSQKMPKNQKINTNKLFIASNNNKANAIKKQRGVIEMAKSNAAVPQAREALDKFKMEAAREVGVNLKQGYNGDLTSKEAGSVGGQMVKKMIEAYENGMK